MFFSCKKDIKLNKLEFNVETEQLIYFVGENVEFKFKGTPDIITMYAGELGNKYDQNNDYAITLKGVSDKMSSYSYVFSKPGIYDVVFKAKNQNIYNSNEIVKRVKLKIIGKNAPGILAAVDYVDKKGGTINEQVDRNGNQSIDDLTKGDFLILSANILEKGKILFETLARAEENSDLNISVWRNEEQLFECSLTIDYSEGSYQFSSSLENSPELDKGEVKIKVEIIRGKLSLKYLNVHLFEGFSLPGKIMAVDYAMKEGGRVESNPVVENGVFLGGINNGNYFVYDVNVIEEGEYKIDYHLTAARTCTFDVFAIEPSGANSVLERINFSSTGGWNHWTTVSGANFYLTKGPKRIKLVTVANGMSLSWIKFEKVN